MLTIEIFYYYFISFISILVAFNQNYSDPSVIVIRRASTNNTEINQKFCSIWVTCNTIWSALYAFAEVVNGMSVRSQACLSATH